MQKRAFSRVGAKICNEMPASLREPTPPAPTTTPEKKKVKQGEKITKKNRISTVSLLIF